MSVHNRTPENSESFEKSVATVPSFTRSLAIDSQANGAQISALRGSSEMPKSFGTFDLSDNENILSDRTKLAGFGIEPCTPPGKDPLLDPANPKSPNYDADSFRPHPAQPMVPGGKLLEPELLPYGGECKPVIDPKDLIS